MLRRRSVNYASEQDIFVHDHTVEGDAVVSRSRRIVGRIAFVRSIEEIKTGRVGVVPNHSVDGIALIDILDGPGDIGQFANHAVAYRTSSLIGNPQPDRPHIIVGAGA